MVLAVQHVLHLYSDNYDSSGMWQRLSSLQILRVPNVARAVECMHSKRPITCYTVCGCNCAVLKLMSCRCYHHELPWFTKKGGS